VWPQFCWPICRKANRQEFRNFGVISRASAWCVAAVAESARVFVDVRGGRTAAELVIVTERAAWFTRAFRWRLVGHANGCQIGSRRRRRERHTAGYTGRPTFNAKRPLDAPKEKVTLTRRRVRMRTGHSRHLWLRVTDIAISHPHRSWSRNEIVGHILQWDLVIRDSLMHSR